MGPHYLQTARKHPPGPTLAANKKVSASYVLYSQVVILIPNFDWRNEFFVPENGWFEGKSTSSAEVRKNDRFFELRRGGSKRPVELQSVQARSVWSDHTEVTYPERNLQTIDDRVHGKDWSQRTLPLR